MGECDFNYFASVCNRILPFSKSFVFTIAKAGVRMSKLAQQFVGATVSR